MMFRWKLQQQCWHTYGYKNGKRIPIDMPEDYYHQPVPYLRFLYGKKNETSNAAIPR